MQIIDVLARDGESSTLAGLSREIATPKSSVLNILRSLTASGYVSHVGGNYQLGPESYRLASAILATRQFPEIAQPFLVGLVKQTGETALIGRLSEDMNHLVYMAKWETTESLRFAAMIGDRRPLYRTSGGIILLAYHASIDFDRYWKVAKAQAAERGEPLNKREFQDRVSQARENGFAVNSDGSTRGVTGVAAPIFDGLGIVASLTVAIPSVRVDERLHEISRAAVATAREISRVMGADRP